MKRTTPSIVLCLGLAGLLTACVGGSAAAAAASAGPSTPTGTAGDTDAPCIPATQNQGCHNLQRMWCEDTTSTWQQLGSCASDKRCIELPDPTKPGASLAKCDDIPVPAVDAGSTDGSSSGGSSSGGSSSGGSSSGGGTVTAVCKRWLLDRANLAEGEWTGSKAKCDPGTLSTEAKDIALRLVNLYRFLSHMPEAKRDPELDAKAQQCALMMYANNSITHNPPKSWKCYTADGALAAKRSNLSTGPGVRAVDRYMIDMGAHNKPTLGHRRWILSHSLDCIGVGSSTIKGSCLWVIGGKGSSPRKWVAWPNDGKVPLAAFSAGGSSIDKTGWSLQSDSISFAKAKIVVSSGGKELKTTQWLLKGGYGSKYAIAWTPSGWNTEAGKTYKVEVKGSSADFAYEVEVVDCSQ